MKLNYLQKKTLDLKNTRFLVVDEADSVFDHDINLNFFQIFVGKLLKESDFKTIMTSATMTDNFRKVVQSFQEKRNIFQIEIPVEKLTLTNVQQFMIQCTDIQSKVLTLVKLMEVVQAQNILIFGNKRADLADLEKFLVSRNYKAAFIYKSDSRDNHQNKSADYVQEKINDFMAGKIRILLTTNLLSRGIDMRKVTLVVNLALPFKMKDTNGMAHKKADLETYLHRVGRTGRFGDKGIAVNFVNNEEEMAMMQDIQGHYQNKVEKINTENLGELDKKLQDIQCDNKKIRQYLEEEI